MPIIAERFGKGPASSYPYSAKTITQMTQAMKFFWGSRLMRRLFG